eukprot:3651825-Pleurochrysis_carterae.AAC.1
MQPWARGVVWDCADPGRCVPVRRSTRHTRFPGERQLNREALREAAAKLGWHDEDIIGQAGEGRVEARAECELATVLASHHRGLCEQSAAAAAAVAADTAVGLGL